jgi:hypothetical protein
MIFEADPEQIKALDSKELVRLMDLLLLAECRLARIPLRAAHVALQITISDGGEDGRVEWTGGVESTPYLPSRYSIFQSKAQNLTETSIKAEILKKVARPKKSKSRKTNSKNNTKARTAKRSVVLSEAISEVLKRRGAYTILSSAAFTGPKRDKLKKAIEKAIKDGGKNPRNLAAIEVLDANKIAEWVNVHPSVALWLAKHTRRRSLAGFQTHEGWGKSSEIRVSPWVPGSDARFVAVNVFVPERDRAEPQNKAWTFEQAAEAVLKQISKEQQSVRIAGPSGFGKSRFLYEVFNRRTTIGEQTDNAAIIYADYSIAGDEVAKLALEIAEGGSSSILVVDECPDQLHHKLASIARREDSNLRIATIDVETRIEQASSTLTIRLEPASKEMISAIVKGVDPNIPENAVGFIQELSHGFPQMAVLAAKQKGSKKQTIQSAAQYVDRVLWGHDTPNEEAERALSTLSLFDWVGIDGRVQLQAEYISSQLARMSFDAFVEHIKSFKSRGIVIQRGDFVQVQPIPLAARLAGERLPLLPDGKLLLFFTEAPAELRASLLKRIRWLDTVAEARAFATALLAPEALGNYSTLNTALGSEVLDRLVHVAPDVAMTTIDREFGSLSIDELESVVQGRRHLVWALEKLAFRKETFTRAATFLRKLAAAETEDRISNNASGQFKGLFHIYLSGTEATPNARLKILDEGLRSRHARERELCIDALDAMLETGHYSRSGGAEEIGSADALIDWQPETYGEIRDFYRAAIDRLKAIALHDDSFALKAKLILGKRLRSLFNQFEPPEIKQLIDEIVRRYGFWPDAIQEINEWLYFDSKEAPTEIKKQIRSYFDELLPTDIVALAELYCHGWQTDFHDPDSTYDTNTATDFEYASRKSVELATQIAADEKLLDRALDTLVTSDAKSVFGFSRRLAEVVANPVVLFDNALSKAESGQPNLQFFGGIITGADGRDPKLARACIRAALRSEKLKPHAISMIGSGRLQPDDLKLVISLLQSGDVEPFQCASLRFDHLTTKEVAPLLHELVKRGASGLWTALDIIFMYLYPAKEPDEVLTAILKDILIAPNLFDQINRRHMDGYHLDETVALLAKHRKFDGDYVSKLVKRMLGLSEVKESGIFFELDDPVRKILSRLLTDFPKEVWAEVAPLLIASDSLRQHYVRRLVGVGHGDHLELSPLGKLPRNIYLDWVRTDPAGRGRAVMNWLPLVTKNGDGSLSWHPELDAFVTEFGATTSVLDEIGSRMHPKSWWGSIVPHLELWLPLLQQWLNHPLVEVQAWAQNRIEPLQKYIAAEKKRDEEDVVRWG